MDSLTGPNPGPMKNRSDFPLAVHQLIALKQHAEKQIRTFRNICDADNVQLKKRHSWNVNGGSIGHNIFPLLQPGGRHRNGKNKYRDRCGSHGGPLQHERIIVDFFKEFPLQATAIPL